MENVVLVAVLFLLFLIWAIAWPHVRLSRQAARLSALERRVAVAERALTAAMEAAAPAADRAAEADAAQHRGPSDEAPAGAGPSAQPSAAAGPVPDAAAQGERQSPSPSEADVSEAAQAPASTPPKDWRAHWPGAAARGGAPSQSLEERLGAKWSVLVGGAALAIGALLLVRYTIEAGPLGPAARVVCGLLLGAGLIAAGEWTRRRETPALGRVSIPATLTAAGAAAVFAAIYAAHALYGFIGPATAFLLLGATGVATMAAATLHGTMLAGLGLVASFVTPILVDSRSPAPWPLVVYLLCVTATAYGVASTRRWFALALATLAGATLWQTALALGGATDFQIPALAHGLIQTALALAVFARPHAGAATGPRTALSAWLAPLAIAAATLLVVLVVEPGGSLTARVAGGVALTALLAAGGALAGAAAPLSLAAGLFAVAVAALWPMAVTGGFVAHWLFLLSEPLEPASFVTFAALAGAVAALVPFERLRRFEAAALPCALYGAAGAAAPLLLLAVAYARMTGLDVSGPFATAAGGLGVAFTLIAASLRAQAQTRFEARLALGFAALGALGALAIGLAAALSGGSLTVAWGLSALAAAWLALRLDVAALRWGVAAMGALVAGRLVYEPRVLHELSATPIFNWLLIGYGAPALAFAIAARLMRAREDVPLQVARGLAVALTGFLVFLEIRHAMNGGDIYARRHGLVEVGMQAFSATMFAIVLTKIGGARPPTVYRVATAVAGAVAATLAAIGLLIAENPYLSHEALSRDGFINELIPGYLAPAAGAAALAIIARPFSTTKARVAAAAAMTLLFAFVTLETRAQFHERTLNHALGVTEPESLTLSAVWLGLGLAMLAYGVARRSKEARIGSAILVVLATAKVFLIDLAGLTGAWRAFSFIGLGLTLIGIGAVYQRVLFPKRPAGEADAQAGEGL
jgi:uncharacterized membrane protein